MPRLISSTMTFNLIKNRSQQTGSKTHKIFGDAGFRLAERKLKDR